MKPRYLILLAISGLALGGFWFWNIYFGMVPPDPDELVQTALTGADLREKVNAAATLAGLKEPDPTPLLRHVAENSNDPEVLIEALNGLAARGDAPGVALFIANMQNASPQVRAAAWAGIQRIYGPVIPENLNYKPDGPADEREKAARRLKKMFDEFKAGKA